MPIKESIGVIPSAILQTRRDEMANAKEFDARNAEATRSRGCKPGTCISTCKCACIPPPKCGPGPCKNITVDEIKG